MYFSGNPLFFYRNANFVTCCCWERKPKCFSALCTIGTGCGLSRQWGYRPIPNLDLFPSVSSKRAIAFCRTGLFKEKSLLSFCPFHSSPNVPVLSGADFICSCAVCACFFSKWFCVWCAPQWQCWRSRTALPTLERALRRRGPKNRLFLLEYFHMCCIALNFVYLSQGWRRMGWSITVYFCSAVKEHFMKYIHCSILWILIHCLVKIYVNAVEPSIWLLG